MTDAILSEFEFLDYRIDQFHFSRTEPPPLGERFRYSIKFETGVRPVEPESEDPAEAQEHVENEVLLRVWLEWEPSPGPFELKLSLIGRFRRHPDMPAQAFANFSEVVGPSILFSHARPIIKFMMDEAGEPFRLPLLNISDTIKARRAAEAKAAKLESDAE